MTVKIVYEKVGLANFFNILLLFYLLFFFSISWSLLHLHLHSRASARSCARYQY